MQDPHPQGCDQWGLLGGLGQHRIARAKGGANLPSEDGQREVPGADAHYWPQWNVRVVVEVAAYLGAIKAQKVHRFADFSDGVDEGFACLADQYADQLMNSTFHQLGRPLQGRGALTGWSCLPCLRAFGGTAKGVVHILFGRLLY